MKTRIEVTFPDDPPANPLLRFCESRAYWPCMIVLCAWIAGMLVWILTTPKP